jgi:oligosaccharide reducing-end xylanase
VDGAPSLQRSLDRRHPARRLVLGGVVATVLAGAAVGCQGTVDSLGYNDPKGIVLRRMTGPDTYPNAFGTVLGKSDEQIADKIADTFAQLFHGDPSSEAIYVPVGQTQGYIEDVYNGDVRTEGMGLAMLITLQLNKRDEFDRLWNYTKANLVVATGPAKGYINSSCGPPSQDCLDPYGLQHILMALLLANQHWDGLKVPDGEYAKGAKELLTVMRHKEDQNGGIVGGVTNSFDVATGVVLDQPLVSSANVTRPSILTPAFYYLWAQATGDPYWSRAAASARAFWKKSAHPKTGFMPTRALLDGTPATMNETFSRQAYRTQINVVLDRIWSRGDDWEVVEADNLLETFIAVGLNTYGSEFSLDGKTIDVSREYPLIIANGIAGLISTVDQRKAFIEAVWNQALVTGTLRYYTGILDMLGLLILGGQFRIP